MNTKILFAPCSEIETELLAVFAVDANTGLLTSAGWVPTRGRIPRFIGFDPVCRFLYAANEQSDTVVSWLADSSTGRLTPTEQVIRNASPVAIAFASWGA